MTEFPVSFFNHKKDSKPKQELLTWQKLVERLKLPVVRKAKDGKMFSPAKLNGTRGNGHVESIALLVLDYDHDGDFARDVAVWHELGLRAVAHTTHGHLRKTETNPNADPRFRVIIALSEPISPANFPALWQWACEKSGGRIDPAPKAVSNAFYLPAVASKDAPFEFEEIPGALLDWRTLDLADAAQPSGDDSEIKSKVAAMGALILESSRAEKLSKSKFDMLEEIDSKFKLNCEGKRKEASFKKGSSGGLDASAYDLSNANIAAAAGWTDQEIADLIIWWRTKHGFDLKLRQDYYQSTIAKARREHSHASAMEALQNDDSTPETKVGTISTLIGTKITRLERHLTDPPKYVVTLGNGRTVEMKSLRNQNNFAEQLGHQANFNMALFKGAVWHQIVSRMFEVVEDVQAAAEGTHLGSLTNWLQTYIRDCVHPERVAEAQRDAILERRPGLMEGFVWFSMTGFKRYVQCAFAENPIASDLAVRLKQIGCEFVSQKTVPTEAGAHTTRSLWKVPRKLLPEELVNDERLFPRKGRQT